MFFYLFCKAAVVSSKISSTSLTAHLGALSGTLRLDGGDTILGVVWQLLTPMLALVLPFSFLISLFKAEGERIFIHNVTIK